MTVALRTARFAVLLSVALLYSSLAAAGNPNLSKIASKHKGQSVAIVALSANNFGNSLQGWNSAVTSDLMKSRMDTMLAFADEAFAKHWKVIPVASYIDKPAYLQLAGPDREVGVPHVNGRAMPLMADDRKQLVKCLLSPEKATALTAATGADLIVVIYSEWAVATGSFIPTSKPLTKNVVGIYDASGKSIYQGRLDQMGKKTLGGGGRVAVNENTIDHWVDAYETALSAMLGVK